MIRKEFFTASEVATELTARTSDKQKWTVIDVHELAIDGRLPVCFEFQGNIGVFDRMLELTELFAIAKRSIYLPRSHLRAHSGVALDVKITHLNGKIDRVDQLHPGPVEIVKAARGFDAREYLTPSPDEVLWLLSKSRAFRSPLCALMHISA